MQIKPWDRALIAVGIDPSGLDFIRTARLSLETTGTGPARCAFSVGLEFGDRPCAIAPMKPAYAKASAFADATAAALCAMAVKTADKSARQPAYAKASAFAICLR